MTPESWDALAEDLRAGRLDAEVPPHGTLSRVQRSVGLPAGAPEARPPSKQRRAVKKAVTNSPPAAIDAAGQPVALGTSPMSLPQSSSGRLLVIIVERT